MRGIAGIKGRFLNLSLRGRSEMALHAGDGPRNIEVFLTNVPERLGWA